MTQDGEGKLENASVAGHANVVTSGMMLTTNLPKLDGRNYQSWVELVTIVLELKGLKSAITSEGVDTMIDLQAKLIILETMVESHRAQVRGCTTSKSIIDRLQLIYADKSAANIYRLLLQYYRYTKRPEDSIGQHIGKMDELRNQLADLGEKQSEAVYQISLIGSLPSEYASIMEIWELTPPEMRTTPNLVARLLRREEDLKKSEESAFLARGAQNKPRMTRKEIEEKKKVTKCNVCGVVGHWAKECSQNPNNKPNSQGSSTGGNSNSTAMVAETENITTGLGELMFQVATASSRHLSDKWVSDSGATSHMSHRRDWFAKLEPLSERSFVTVGDGKRLEIKGVGTIKIDSVVDGRWLPSTMTNVKYVPGLSVNMFSIGAAADRGVISTFVGNECRMSLDGVQVASGTKPTDKLYLMRIRVNQALGEHALKTMEDYHRELGHASTDRIKTLLASLDLEVPKGDSVNCESCPAGKGRHSSHPLRDASVNEPGHLHVDLSGIVNKPSLQGYRYYILCKDQFTDFDIAYPCRNKSEVPMLLARLLVDFETLANVPVKAIYSDNGSEFVNKITEMLFLKNKVKHYRSCPFCPQQNGRIEREMQSINNMARTMLQASKLSTELWPEAVGTAVYIKNRLPNKTSKITPFERCLRQKPQIDNLVTFGTPCHMIINDHYLTKWDSRTVEGFMVGYTSRRNTYKVYIPSKGRIVESCDVIFARHTSKGSPDCGSDQVTLEFQTEGGYTQRHEPAQSCLDQDNSRDHDVVAGESYQNGTEFHTPGSDLGTQTQSTPKKTLCTGERLDEFFKSYVNSDPEYEEVPINQSGRRPLVPPPPPPTYQNTSMTEEGSSTETIIQGQESYQALGQTLGTIMDCRQDLDLNKGREGDESANLVNCEIDNDADNIPTTFTEAMNSDASKNWLEAVEVELDALQKNRTWEVVPIPKHKPTLTTKWVFTIKRDAVGNLQKYKARLVAKGFEQKKGQDYDQTFAPVARMDSIRTVLALCGIKRLNLLQFDISTAFLNGKIEEEVFIDPPQGLEVEDGYCLKLEKALYGLKQASRAWKTTFDDALIEIGFSPTKSDPCVYVNKAREIYLLIYVDDGIVIGPDKQDCQSIVSTLEKRFKLKQLKGDHFLGMRIELDENGLCLSQERYIRDILIHFNMAETKGVTSPMVDVAALMNNEGLPTDAPYLAALGCLQYLACCTRPDISFPVSLLARFSRAPLDKHWTAIKRVIKYLKHTIDHKLWYTHDSARVEPIAYSDADWAGDSETRQSTSGVLVTLGGGPVIYASRKQSTVAQSSTEAEFISANEVTKEIKWLDQFLNELEVKHETPKLLIDNHSTIRQIENNDTKRRSKHIDIKYHYIREQYSKRLFNIDSIETENQPADLLTKALSGPRLNALSSHIGCRSSSKSS